MERVIQQQTTTTVTVQFAEYVLQISDPDSADSFVVGYAPDLGPSRDAVHRQAFEYGLKVLANEGTDPTQCVYEVLGACEEVPGGRYYRVAASFEYLEVLEVIAGTRKVEVNPDPEDFPPPQNAGDGPANDCRGACEPSDSPLAGCVREEVRVTMTPAEAREFIERLTGKAT